MSSKPVITLRSGRHVNPLDVQPEEIDIHDIAHALSQVNRFGGHVSAPISVAQHCAFVSFYVLNVDVICDYAPLVGLVKDAWGEDAPEKNVERMPLQALLHDGAECYLGDISAHLKADPSFAAYRVAEDVLQRRIFTKYGVAEEQHPIVSLADKRVCAFEARQGGMRFASSAWPGYEDPTPDEEHVMLRCDWEFMDWERARLLFLEQFDRLGGVR